MDFLRSAIEHGPYVSLAIASFVSAVFPLVSAELVMVGVAASLPHPNIPVLVAIAASAQMAGKITMYCVGRRAAGLATANHKYRQAIERWGDRLRGSRASVGGLVFLSSASGLPPFYVISTLAGMFRTSFLAFVIAGAAGRVVRFTAVGFFPVAVKALAG
jgi:membrane protein YqaA with SNARE-associated domain